MERLSIHDAPPMQQQGMPGSQPFGSGMSMGANMPLGPAPVPQLPPQMFTTSASLLDLTDKKLIVQLRDGRKLIGVLRSWDQFGNLVLLDTVERIFADKFYADDRRGIHLIRGENILLMGEIDLDKEDDIPSPYQEGDLATVLELQRKEKEVMKRKDAFRLKKLKELGFEGESAGEVLL